MHARAFLLPLIRSFGYFPPPCPHIGPSVHSSTRPLALAPVRPSGQFGIKREKTGFVFTPEMAHVMGGRQGGPYQKFLQLSCRAYNILRKNANTLINLFTLMVPAGMPELAARDDIQYMKDMLALDLDTDADADARFRAEVEACLNNTFRRHDNMFHMLNHI